MPPSPRCPSATTRCPPPPIWQALREHEWPCQAQVAHHPPQVFGVSSSRFSNNIAERFGSVCMETAVAGEMPAVVLPLNQSGSEAPGMSPGRDRPARAPSASERTYSPSLVARGRPESRGRTKLIFLSDKLGLRLMPGSHRVTANASQRNGPSTTRPSSRRWSFPLHSSQAIDTLLALDHDGHDAVAKLPEKDPEVGREEVLEEHGSLGRQPLLYLGLVPGIGHRKALDVLEELLEVLEGIGAEGYRTEGLEVEPQSGIRHGEPEGQGRLAVALMLKDEQREIGLVCRGNAGRDFLPAHSLRFFSGSLFRGDDGRGQGDRAQGQSLMEGEDVGSLAGPSSVALSLNWRGKVSCSSDTTRVPSPLSSRTSPRLGRTITSMAEPTGIATGKAEPVPVRLRATPAKKRFRPSGCDRRLMSPRR